MNNTRRKFISTIIEAIESAKYDLDFVAVEEQEAFDNMPEPFQESERGESMQEGIDTMESVLYALDDVINDLLDLI